MLFDDRHQHIDADGDPDLSFHRILGCTEKCFDPQMLFDPFEEQLAGKGLARCLLARLQPLPFRTAREVFPQAAHPMIFVVRVMRTIGDGVNFHL